MTHEEFKRLYGEWQRQQAFIIMTKNEDYSNDDALANFKIAANDIKSTPLKALWVLVAKHLNAILKVVNGGELKGDAFSEKCKDVANYMFFAYCLNLEKEKEKAEAQNLRD